MSFKLFVRFLWKTGILRRVDVIGGFLGIHKRKIISMIDGGLASQMWEFSLGYAAARKAGLPLYLDLSWFKSSGCDISGQKNRPFNLFNAFPECRRRYGTHVLERQDISSWFKRLYADRIQPEHSYMDYLPESFSRHSMYIGRYYANIRYILPYREELAELFKFECALTPEEQSIRNDILKDKSVALHIRRGDYVGSIHDVCSESYYQKAVDRMLEEHPDATFYVFTNDEEWSKNFISHQTGGYTICCIIEASLLPW